MRHSNCLHLAASLLALTVALPGSLLARPEPPVDVPVNPIYQTGNQTKMDHSNATINDYGCTFVVWTMYINQQLAKAGLRDHSGNPIVYTPESLNTVMNTFKFTTGPADNRYDVNGWGQKVKPDGSLIGDPPNPAPPLITGALAKAVLEDTKAKSGDGKGLAIQTGSHSKKYNSGGQPGSTISGDPDLAKDVNDKLRAGNSVPIRVNDDSGKEGHSVLVTSFHPKDPDVAGSKDRWDIKDPYKDSTGNSTIWLDEDPYKNKIYSTDLYKWAAGSLVAPFSMPSPYFFPEADLLDPIVNPDQYSYFEEIESFASMTTNSPDPSGAGLATALLAGTALRRRRGR